MIRTQPVAPGNCPPPTAEGRRVEVLEYMASLSSEVTAGQLDPATVNWYHIRDGDGRPGAVSLPDDRGSRKRRSSVAPDSCYRESNRYSGKLPQQYISYGCR